MSFSRLKTKSPENLLSSLFKPKARVSKLFKKSKTLSTYKVHEFFCLVLLNAN